MNTNDFLDKVEQSEISHHKKCLMQFLRPSIDILRNKDEQTSLGCSRFGG